MNKYTLSAVSSLLLCTGSAFGQASPTSSQPMRRRIIIGTPEQQATAKTRQEQCYAFNKAGFTALYEGRYSEAEANARQSLAVSHNTDLLAPELFAASLDAQGKNAEALVAYQILADQGSDKPRDLLPYSLLLLKNGQWAEAVAAYNKASPYIASSDLLNENSHFNATEYKPAALAAAIHIGIGMTYFSSAGWFGTSRKEQGMAHLQQALALEPNSPLTNYYYGYGWRNLDRNSPMKAATAARAKAAMRKAAATEDGSLKKAAEKSLKQMP